MVDNVIPRNTFSREEVAETLDGIEGASVLGTLDDELVSLYVSMANAENELDELESAIRRRLIERQAERTIQHAHAQESIEDFYRAMVELRLFDDEAEAADAMKKLARWEHLRATFWLDVRTAFNSWNSWLEVRSGFRVVNLGKKYEA